MISEKQLEANRRNAEKSTGPRTAEGKAISSRNACRHNLTGQVTVMTDEDRVALEKFSTGIIASLAPETAMERQLAHAIAQASWRLNRMCAVEDNIFALGFPGPEADFDANHPQVHAALTQARVFLENPKQFQLLTLYAQRTNRDIEKNMKLLKQLQSERKTTHKSEMTRAVELKKLNELKGLPYDPRQDGFDFSTEAIDRYIGLERRRKEATTAAWCDWSREKYVKAGGSLAA